MSEVEKRLKELGVLLPKVLAPPASFIHAITIDNLVYTSGADCKIDGEFMYTGKLGKDLTIEEGAKAAKQTVINLLAILKEEIGSLDKINRIVKLTIFVNSSKGFHDQPFVANGASDFLIDVFGDKGRHARSAIGTSELPFNIPVEIEMIIELKV